MPRQPEARCAARRRKPQRRAWIAVSQAAAFALFGGVAIAGGIGMTGAVIIGACAADAALTVIVGWRLLRARRHSGWPR